MADTAVALPPCVPMLLLFVVAIFSGAGLLFLVQPMIAKQLLPLLGGSPAVWNTCMVFFQLLLLGGYLYAHLLARLRRRRAQVLVHGLVMLLAALTLPIGLGAGDHPAAGATPSTWLLLTLLTSVGGPFFVLASASPLLQSWFAGTGHRWSADPYFLYAASNAGSMLALLGYPLLVEPRLSLHGQLQGWSWLFVAFALLALAGAWTGTRSGSGPAEPAPDDGPPPAPLGVRRRLGWVALAFLPSSLMLGVTQHISTDIATTPLLWVVPLAIYLATFIVVFTRAGRVLAVGANHAVPVAVVLLTGLVVANLPTPIVPQILVHLVGLLIIGIACHGRLALDRPAPRHLTGFYLWISVGGALGGTFNALLAPVLFDSVAEYPIVLVAVCAVGRPGRRSDPDAAFRWRRLLDPVIGIALVGALFVARREITGFFEVPERVFGFDGPELVQGLVPAVGCLVLLARRWSFVVAIATLHMCAAWQWDDTIVHEERTFFGVLRVTSEPDGSGRWHHLWHGSTAHGSQFSQEPWSKYATRYYTKNGPAGDLMGVLWESDDAQHIALVGLGVGTLAAYGRFDWRMTYYEIDPEVVRIARDPARYTYCRDSAARLDFVVGDARLRLSESDHRYRAIFLDAFSSDAIPVHLVTRDAVGLYLRHLEDNGLLAFHVTNRHLDLLPVLGNIAADLGLIAAVRRDGDISAEDIRLTRKNKSVWVVLARQERALGALARDPKWTRLGPDRSRRTWTDDYSNVFDILRR